MRSCSRPTDWKAFFSTATIRTLTVTNPRVCRADKTVRLVGNFTYWGTPGPNTLGLGIRSRPENRSPLVPLALTDSRRITGKPKNPSWRKEEVPGVPFR